MRIYKRDMGVVASSISKRLNLPEAVISDFCRRNGISRLSLFGSALRTDFAPESDLDILVEFLPGRVPGYLRLAGMENELTRLAGRKVDMRTPNELSPYFRSKVVQESVVQYVHG